MNASVTRDSFYGWRMVALAFVAYNFGLTVVTNVFAPMLVVLQQELGSSRAGVSMAFGLLMLSMGVLSPVAGHLSGIFKLRTLMMVGSAINSAGFLLLAFANTLIEVLLVYGLLIGAGVCFMALISAPALISRWFEQDRGKALGIGLVQAFALITAPLAAWLLSLGGRHLLFFVLAAIFALLIPVMALVIDRPADVGQAPRGVSAIQTTIVPTELKNSREILTDRRFWLLTIAIGVFTAAGVTFTSHGPAMAVANGASLTMASTVLSATGAGALVGALGVGWLIDKVGPFKALIVDLLYTAAMWLVFSHVSSLSLLVALGFFMGAGMGPSVSLHSACINEIFGSENFGRVMGYSYFSKIPFLVGPAPFVGRLYDLSGTYRTTYVLVVTALVIASGVAAVLMLVRKGSDSTPAGTEPSTA